MAENLDLNNVYPWIKKIEGEIDDEGIIVSDSNNHQVNVKLPWHQWLGDLGVFYVIDDGENFKILTSRMMPEDLSEESLFDIACENLLANYDFRIVETNWNGYGIVGGGDFEAVAGCNPDIRAFCADYIGEDYIMAVPARDVVLMAPVGNREAIENLKSVAKEILENGEHILSQMLFYYSSENQSFSVYK